MCICKLCNSMVISPPIPAKIKSAPIPTKNNLSPNCAFGMILITAVVLKQLSCSGVSCFHITWSAEHIFGILWTASSLDCSLPDSSADSFWQLRLRTRVSTLAHRTHLRTPSDNSDPAQARVSTLAHRTPGNSDSTQARVSTLAHSLVYSLFFRHWLLCPNIPITHSLFNKYAIFEPYFTLQLRLVRCLKGANILDFTWAGILWARFYLSQNNWEALKKPDFYLS